MGLWDQQVDCGNDNMHVSKKPCGKEVRRLATVKRYNADTKTWGDEMKLGCVGEGNTVIGDMDIPLRRGGLIRLFPNIISENVFRQIDEEVRGSGLFRQYRIQGINDEPRCHFLLHQDATEDFEDEQPGYRYARITLKARPLCVLPKLEVVTKQLAIQCKVDKWTIGVNPVLYRNGRDRMGDHADDAQGEQLILALLVNSPAETRRVCVRPFGRLGLEHGDEKIELFMRPGKFILVPLFWE
jgi:hypothetical protein